MPEKQKNCVQCVVSGAGLVNSRAESRHRVRDEMYSGSLRRDALRTLGWELDDCNIMLSLNRIGVKNYRHDTTHQ